MSCLLAAALTLCHPHSYMALLLLGSWSDTFQNLILGQEVQKGMVPVLSFISVTSQRRPTACAERCGGLAAPSSLAAAETWVQASACTGLKWSSSTGQPQIASLEVWCSADRLAACLGGGMGTTSPVEPSRCTAALCHPTLGLNLTCLLAKAQ